MFLDWQVLNILPSVFLMLICVTIIINKLACTTTVKYGSHQRIITTCACGCLSLLMLSQAEAAAMDTDSDMVLPSPIPRSRWGEDWSILRGDKVYYEDPSLSFKFVPLNKSGSNYISFGGEYRFADEKYDPADRGLSDIGNQDAALHRVAAHADWHPDERWRVFGQLGYAAASNRDGGNKVGDESDPNIWQLFVDRRFTLNNGDRLDFRLGRQFIEKADWFIGSGEARNVRAYYDGLRVAWLDVGFAKFDAFAAEFVDASPDSFDMSGTDEYFWGATAGFRLERPRLNLSLLYFGWDLKDRQFEQGGAGSHDEKRHSVVLWANKPVSVPDQWALSYYLVYQFGSYDDSADSDIKAFGAFGEFKYALFPGMNTPVLGLKTSYYSGDDDPNDDELNTFYNPVFVTVYFTYARDVMPYNLIHLQPNIGYRFSEELHVSLGNDFLWRASKDDAFYTGASKIGVRADDSDARYIGRQIQLSMNWQPTRNIVASMHLVRFWDGDVIEDAGGKDQNYGRLNFSYLF
jgi:hypothetical protein